MNRPKNWEDLPYKIKEWFLEHHVSLDYDSYEGSREEVLYAALNHGCDFEYPGSTNRKRIENAYENLSDSDLIIITKDFLNGLKDEANSYKELLGE